MSDCTYEWTEVFCSMDFGEVITTMGVVIGAYQITQGWHGYDGFTEGTYDVQHGGTGTRAATYSDFDVACRFAEDLNRTFGDIGPIIERNRGKESHEISDEDNAIFNAISNRKRHPSRLIGGILKPAGDKVQS